MKERERVGGREGNRERERERASVMNTNKKLIFADERVWTKPKVEAFFFA